ncbi:hypothetical protein [Streptomyces sp. NPDC005407]|uniref:hypothetical protein n=1 Tax=Streptomyces sp. NPDC005407 TaxID=3155340 RepID=UPI0033B0A19E
MALQEEGGKKKAADARIRRLLAYARKFHAPRRYPLNELAEASGYTISGVRTAYDDEEVTLVARQINRRATDTADGDGQEQS